MGRVRALFARKEAKELAAVNLYAGRVEVARIRRDPAERPVVEVCAQFESAGNHAEVLQRLRRELHLDRYRCTTTLTGGQYQVQVVEAPNVPQAELKSAVRWRLKDFLDYPLESATVDVLTVPGPVAANRGKSVLAISARNETISAAMQLFAKAKIPLRVIEIPEMAQRNLAALFENDGRAIAVLSFGEEGGLLTFTAGGDLYLSRRMEVTLEQLMGSSADSRNQLFDRIALELQRSLDHFDRQHSNVPLSRVMIAPLPEEIGLAEYLAGNLSAKVEPVNLGDYLDFHPVPEMREASWQNRCWQTLGAALRVESP
jgi:MSHA biogenesis protein MshI